MFNTLIREKLIQRIEHLTEPKCLALLVKLYEDDFNRTRTARTQAGCSRYNTYRNEYIKEKLLFDTQREFTEQQINKALHDLL